MNNDKKNKRFGSLALILGLSLFYMGLQVSNAQTIRHGPVGVMDLVNMDMPPAVLAADPGWTNPNVKGYLIRMSWKTVEPSKGVYNFATFDQACLLAAAHGKTVGLSIGAGTMTPAWVYTAGAKQFSITIADGSTEIMPLPWDPVFQSNWSTMISALGQRYAFNPVVNYVTMAGIGRDFESSVTETASDTANFNTLGGQTLWVPAAVKIAKFFTTSFPNTHIVCAMGSPIPDPGNTGTGHTMMDTVVNDMLAACPHQFGVACDSLTGVTPAQTPAVTYIEAQYKNTSCGFQMFLPSPKVTGSTLAQGLALGVEFKAHYVEVYSYDCALSTQQSALVSANTGLAANSGFHP